MELLACLDGIHELPGVAEAVCCSSSDLQVANGDIGDLDAFETADVFIFYVIGRTACEQVVDCSESSLHNAAGSTEYDTGSRCAAERIVESRIAQFREFDTQIIYHSSKFSCSDDDIHIRMSVYLHFRPCSFVFLGCTRHYGYHHDIFRIQTVPFRIESLEYCTEHLVR